MAQNRTTQSKATIKVKFRRSLLHPLVFGLLTGVSCGVIISLFTVCARVVIDFAFNIYAHKAPLAIVCGIILLLLCCFLTAFIQSLRPAAKGSGIPLAEGAARGALAVNGVRDAAALAAGSLLSFVCGMPLGSEGPCVGIGGLGGESVGRACRQPIAYRRYMITGGSCAGLAVAFNAPLTGIAFAFEETHRRFTPALFAAALSAVAAAVCVAQAIYCGFGHLPYLNGLGVGAGFSIFPQFRLTKVASGFAGLCGVALVCGIACGIVGVVFNQLTRLFSSVFGRIRSNVLRLLPVFALTGVFGWTVYQTIGSGEATLHAITTNSAWLMILGVLCVRLCITALASGSGATGGLFLPLLCIGGLVGIVSAKCAIACGLSKELANNIIIICMSATFAAAVRAPITAIILSVELTASFANLLPCVIAVAAAAFFADFTKTEPLYERVLEELQNRVEVRDDVADFVKVKGVVTADSIICNKRIRNVMWPHNSLVTSLVRNGGKIVPDGETVLLADDLITVCGEKVNRAAFTALIGEYTDILPQIGIDKSQ